jgi:hypothetical protein
MPRFIRNIETDDIVFDDGAVIKIKKCMSTLDAAEIRKLVDKDNEDLVVATVFRNIVSWDLQENNKDVPVTIENLKALNNQTVVALFSAIGERNVLPPKKVESTSRSMPVSLPGQSDKS